MADLREKRKKTRTRKPEKTPQTKKWNKRKAVDVKTLMDLKSK